MPDELVKRHVVASLELQRDRDELIDERIEAQAARGSRVVNGVLLDQQEWAIVDCSTGETLVSGDGGWKRLKTLVGTPQGEDWVWLDTLTRDLRGVTTRGLPASLRTLLDGWVANPSVPHSEIAAFIGWTAAEVAEARAD
ncbi:hypothetical protein ABZ234_08345 [Nocardiopsis sp. NPDC006198]|uniref:hypothetical protein n=1 Tax=Nocardiopsis sp. NPDC006198 TaxID=3154472 RepID=UPI0033BD7C1D